MPDVAFVLDSNKPETIDVGSLDNVHKKSSVVIGLNISGLLFNGGYTQENMFGLKTNYRELLDIIVDYLMRDKRNLILLVPHVLSPSRTVEDDPYACRQLYEKLVKKYPDRIFLTQGEYNHNNIKYVIGWCDFFIGSLMHACIAALSQSIPAVGIAYSKKFHGVFESVGLGDSVVDAYQCDSNTKLVSIVENAYEKRDQSRKHLNEVIPKIKAEIMEMLEVWYVTE